MASTLSAIQSVEPSISHAARALSVSTSNTARGRAGWPWNALRLDTCNTRWHVHHIAAAAASNSRLGQQLDAFDSGLLLCPSSTASCMLHAAGGCGGPHVQLTLKPCAVPLGRTCVTKAAG